MAAGNIDAVVAQAKIDRKRLDSAAIGPFSLTAIGIASVVGAGIFVTTGAFTKDAEEEARTQERRKVTLIDLERLFDLWVEYYPKLEEPARRRFPIQPIYFLAPED